MSISIRNLFYRQGIDNDVVSIRNALSNHDQGLLLGLREAHHRFLTPASGNGYARGCHRPSQTIAGDLAYIVPSWVSADDHETRTIEGIAIASNVSSTDFPLRPWHTYYDWCLKIRVDNQYRYLLSESNVYDHEDVLECEWDSAYLPYWAWPQIHKRIWMVGRWIYDCGHPETYGHKTEIHPPKALVSFGMEAVHFTENSGPTRANVATVYIGQEGGYWQQPINDQDYAFDLHLPPQPYPEAVPVWQIQAWYKEISIIPILPFIWQQTSSLDRLPLLPQINPYATTLLHVLRVVIPLKNVIPAPDEYGITVAAGWSDPRHTESVSIQRITIRLARIYMDGNYDLGWDSWHVYIGINGRWKVWREIGGSSQLLDFSLDIDLHPDDMIHITACGFDPDSLHDYMGKNSDYTWSQISDPMLTQEQREAIEDHVFYQLLPSLKDENDEIGHVSCYHPSTVRGSFVCYSDKRDYRLEYSIESR